MSIPAQPKIYHIVHVDNISSIIADGCLWSDAVMVRRQDITVIGMSRIKQWRLGRAVSSHKGLMVGDCVPFYFCPRSVMLFVIHRANHPDLAYRGGQQPIVHLEADLHQVVQWAGANGRHWTFSLSNATAAYTQFRARLDQLGEIDWDAVAASDFRPADIQEAKQAEFLVQRSFPWHLVERIGVYSQGIALRVVSAMSGAAHRPKVEVKKELKLARFRGYSPLGGERSTNGQKAPSFLPAGVPA
ncbi:DUF4433 domain-containing protein [bacterium]|nr:MAG: DUF4433 domain-containing protein [bacterium]